LQGVATTKLEPEPTEDHLLLLDLARAVLRANAKLNRILRALGEENGEEEDDP
jgi:hypothetical protein